MPTSIILNVKLDYLPNKLISSVDCQNQCQNVIVGKLLSGDTSATSITSHYLSGTNYSFTVEVEYGRSYIGRFEIEISIDRVIGLKYFTPIKTSNTLIVDVIPSYLAAVSDSGNRLN